MDTPEADRAALTANSKFTRRRERLGALPIINHFADSLGLDALLERFVALSRDPRQKISPAG